VSLTSCWSHFLMILIYGVIDKPIDLIVAPQFLSVFKKL
jgi:hypothetical protein